MEKLIYSKLAAAETIHRSPKHIDRLIDRGELEALIEGRQVRITGDSLRAYIAKLPRLKAKEAQQ